MTGLLLKIPSYRLFRSFGFPKILPLFLTVNVTNRCNSACKTCGIYNRNLKELSLREIEKTFSSFKGDILGLNITGGEPSLREDLAKVCISAYRNLSPRMINIPTNGMLCQAIVNTINEILKECPKVHINVNLSLDEFGEKHDELRGIRDNFKSAINTFNELRNMHRRNFSLGIHTVLSKYNIKSFPDFSRKLIGLNPDTYTFEIAQERAELNNIGLDIEPDLKEYLGMSKYFRKYLRNYNSKIIIRMTQSFNFQYYELTARMLKKKKQVIPCYAGFNSAYITCDGDVCLCCSQARSMGNLSHSDYDFRKIWFGSSARSMRKEIKDKRCFCPVSGVSYSNMLCDINSLWKIGLRFLKSCLR